MSIGISKLKGIIKAILLIEEEALESPDVPDHVGGFVEVGTALCVALGAFVVAAVLELVIFAAVLLVRLPKEEMTLAMLTEAVKPAQAVIGDALPSQNSNALKTPW